MSHLPERYCVQEFPQTICVLCVFHNLLQKAIFDTPCQFFSTVEQIAHQTGRTLGTYYNRHGIWPGVLEILFDSYGIRTVELKKKNTFIHYGWVIVKLKWKKNEFLHAIAIVDGYIVDSYRISKNKDGIYPWTGRILGYDEFEIISLHKIKNPAQLNYIKKEFLK